MRTASRARSPSEIRWLSERLFGTGFGRLLTAAKEVSPISGRAGVRPRYATFCTLFDFEAVFSPKGVVRRIPHDRAARTVLCAHSMTQRYTPSMRPPAVRRCRAHSPSQPPPPRRRAQLMRASQRPSFERRPRERELTAKPRKLPTPSSKRFVSAPGARCSSAATLVSLPNQVDAGAELRISKSRAREIQTRAVRELQ